MVDLFSVNKFYRGTAVRNNQKNEKIVWKKPVVKTLGDGIKIIKDHDGPFIGGKHTGPTDGYLLADGTPISDG